MTDYIGTRLLRERPLLSGQWSIFRGCPLYTVRQNNKIFNVSSHVS